MYVTTLHEQGGVCSATLRCTGTSSCSSLRVLRRFAHGCRQQDTGQTSSTPLQGGL